MKDEVIRPTQSAFFSRAVAVPRNWNQEDLFGPHRDPEQLLAICDTDLWLRDTIGLRSLWNQQRVFVYRSPTHHEPLPTEEYVNIVARFLRGVVGNNANSTAVRVVLESICHEEVDMQVLVL